MVVARSFVCAQPYDMASCLAMFTNLSATVLLIARLEMHFHEKYKAYSEAVIGGRGADIRNCQKRMFRQLSAELLNLARMQFMITVVVFLLCEAILPQYGISGLVMRIYPCLAAGYFILFLMYAEIIFLYYFNDNLGAMLTAVVFAAATGGDERLCRGAFRALVWAGRCGWVVSWLDGWIFAAALGGKAYGCAYFLPGNADPGTYRSAGAIQGI